MATWGHTSTTGQAIALTPQLTRERTREILLRAVDYGALWQLVYSALPGTEVTMDAWWVKYVLQPLAAADVSFTPGRYWLTQFSEAANVGTVAPTGLWTWARAVFPGLRGKFLAEVGTAYRSASIAIAKRSAAIVRRLGYKVGARLAAWAGRTALASSLEAAGAGLAIPTMGWSTIASAVGVTLSLYSAWEIFTLRRDVVDSIVDDLWPEDN